MKRTLCLVLLLVGCGQSQNSDNYEYGWNYDEQGTTGIRVRYSEYSPSLSDIEAMYNSLCACLGVTPPPGPLIIFAPLPNGIFGKYLYDTRTIIVDDTLSPPDFYLRHEMKHHVLSYAGVPFDENDSHEHIAFLTCL